MPLGQLMSGRVGAARLGSGWRLRLPALGDGCVPGRGNLGAPGTRAASGSAVLPGAPSWAGPLVAGLVRPSDVHDLDGQAASRAEHLVRHRGLVQQARPARPAMRPGRPGPGGPRGRAGRRWSSLVPFGRGCQSAPPGHRASASAREDLNRVVPCPGRAAWQRCQSRRYPLETTHASGPGLPGAEPAAAGRPPRATPPEELPEWTAAGW